MPQALPLSVAVPLVICVGLAALGGAIIGFKAREFPLAAMGAAIFVTAVYSLWEAIGWAF